MITKCPLCRTRKTIILGKISSYKLFRCIYCQVIFIFPQSNLAKIERNNLNRYDSLNSVKQYFKIKDIFLHRAEKCTKFLKKYKASGKLLDIGCSFGFYLRVFHQKGYKTLGIDISAQAAKYINNKLGLTAVVGKFDNYNFKNNSFDIITMFDVFEHFPNPQEVLAKANKLLKKNGIIIIQTPNYSSIMSRLTRLNWIWLLIPQHLYLYSTNTIRYLFKKNNFEIIHISTWDDYHEFMNNILMILGIKYYGKTAFLHRIFIKLKYLLFPLAYLWNKFYLGGELLVYAQKK